MLTTKNTTLVAGAAQLASMESPVTVSAVRGFMYCGKAVPIGTTLELPAPLARELIAMGKAVRAVVVEVPAPADDETQETPRRRGRPPKQAEEQET